MWQVKTRSIGVGPEVEALPSVADASDERWATDLARVWTAKDRWLKLALVMN